MAVKCNCIIHRDVVRDPKPKESVMPIGMAVHGRMAVIGRKSDPDRGKVNL